MKKPLIDRTTGENVVAFGRPLAEDGGVLSVERPKSDAVSFHPGDVVTWRDTNLRSYRGVVVSSLGNWTVVKWGGVPNPVKEWTENLRVRS